MTDSIKTYAAAEQYILEIPKFTKKNSIENTKCFLEHIRRAERHVGCLGEYPRNPEKKVRTIHVAGTNGKGSVCAYLHSILREAGFSVGMFTSPHLVTMRERFVINGEMVSEEKFLWAFQYVAAELDNMPETLREISYHPTFFEFLFFMSVVLFEHAQVEYIILETGLGGRLDATNSIDDKDVCVITSIGYDHMEYLGETLPEIAAEKAGIFRKNVPVVYFDKEKTVTDILEKCAASKEAATFSVSFQAIKEINSNNKTIDFSLHSNYYGYIRLRVPTIALYQIENAALAVTAIEQLADRNRIGDDHLREGISRTYWEGRMEEILPSVYLDGAHNTDGIQAFLQTVKQDGVKGKRRLLFSMVKEKQYQAVMDMIASSELFDVVGVAALQDKRALSLQDMADYFGQYTGLQIRKYDRLDCALEDLVRGCGEEDRVYIVGSLYLAGEVKALLRRPSHDQF